MCVWAERTNASAQWQHFWNTWWREGQVQGHSFCFGMEPPSRSRSWYSRYAKHWRHMGLTALAWLATAFASAQQQRQLGPEWKTRWCRRLVGGGHQLTSGISIHRLQCWLPPLAVCCTMTHQLSPGGSRTSQVDSLHSTVYELNPNLGQTHHCCVPPLVSILMILQVWICRFKI